MPGIPTIYLETTMFNFYVDKDRDAHADTVKLFKEIAQKNMMVIHRPM
jgi:hypothetical protein